MDKKALRLKIRQQKQAMTPDQIQRSSARLCQMFFETEQYQNAKTVYSYLPYNQEVQTIPILERAVADGKAVAVPKVYGDTMRFIYITSIDQTAAGYSGIPEPIADGPVANDPTALVLMPGLAFDRAGHRIGYGGGFYDKFLAQEPCHPTLALCYEFQVLSHLETEEFDIPVDCVLWA